MTPHLPFLIAAVLVALVPVASAQSASSTVLLHDLYENDAYVGCHVTTLQYASFRLTVKEGTSVTLTVQAPTNNTNVHTLSVERLAGPTRPLVAGAEASVEFVADEAGSFAVLCDETPGSLQGLLVVQKTDTGSAPPAKESPAAGALGVTGAALVALALARGRD